MQVEPGQTAALQLLRNDRYKLPDAEPEPINGEKEHQRFPEFSNHQSMPDLAKLTIHNQGKDIINLYLTFITYSNLTYNIATSSSAYWK